MYSKKKLDAYYFTTKGFYAFFIPVRVPYKQIYPMADSAGVKKKETFGPIMESGKSFGFGWIGVEIEKPSQPRNDVKNVTGEFETYEHKGAYKTLGKAYRKIMKERPSADDVTSIRHAYLLKILIQRNNAKMSLGPEVLLHVLLLSMKTARLITFLRTLWLLALKVPTQKCVSLETSGRRF